MPSTPAQTTGSAAAVVERPRAFYSYSHLDWESSVRLVEELKLGGFTVFRDIERMREGRPLEDEMAEGIDDAHLLMCLLTENSLASEPVVESELKPALRKTVREGLPVFIPVVLGLGANHQEVTERTWPVLQHDFSATWSGGILPNATNPLSPDDAAAMAGKAVAAVFSPDRGPADGAWRLQLTTRGTPAAADGLSVDAPRFSAASAPRSGTRPPGGASTAASSTWSGRCALTAAAARWS